MQIDPSVAAIVTGGASGLGEATSRMLAAQGAKVALFDLNAERGGKVAAEIGGLFVSCDVTSEASVDEALAKARAAQGVARILVNCAGIAPGRRIVSKKRETGELIAHDTALFEKALAINLTGTFRMLAKSAAALAGLDPVTADGGRGVFVCTASIAAEDGQIGQAAYAASKAGVAGMTLPIARELAASGIRVMTIMPGLFETPMFDGLPEEARASLAVSVPHPSRLGKPAEYAALVKSIIENDMLNGSAIRLDGALRMAAK
ncbi:MAG TPA: SDR family NAD(P)-dependent oxidoreductase [Bosea sp. (in: a-proteobacteria)]|uniref:SDR family NAD(P)-dependent oxidoreductase n=1 Tax=Bosea sp. (in: a-proteobacteria) TaxID=1871050 RepID=UPI002DDC9A99|nr:SDR family NAD(P)-dependent oxidoreductase [Bosea sp. (in: a-proteobacteria)]HEV2555499.1 SDR family NAD(P)-dependent oxidoreductase [Bosea sp. (in: a-proteobacteria)]